MRDHAKPRALQRAGAGGPDAFDLLLVDVFQRLGKGFAEGARVGQQYRQRPRHRAGAEGAREDDGPDQAIHPAQKVEHPAKGKAHHAEGRKVAGGQKRQGQENQRRPHGAKKRHQHRFKQRPCDIAVMPHLVGPEVGRHQGQIAAGRINPVSAQQRGQLAHAFAVERAVEREKEQLPPRFVLEGFHLGPRIGKRPAGALTEIRVSVTLIQSGMGCGAVRTSFPPCGTMSMVP